MISYSGETGEDNCEATLATGASLRNNVHQYGGPGGSNTSKKRKTLTKVLETIIALLNQG